MVNHWIVYPIWYYSMKRKLWMIYLISIIKSYKAPKQFILSSQISALIELEQVKTKHKLIHTLICQIYNRFRSNLSVKKRFIKESFLFSISFRLRLTTIGSTLTESLVSLSVSREPPFLNLSLRFTTPQQQKSVIFLFNEEKTFFSCNPINTI